MINFNYLVTLRPLTDADSEKIRAWRNNPEIYKWSRQYEPLSKEHHDRWVASLAGRQDVKMFSIWDTAKDTLIGVCGLSNIDLVNRNAEFSIYLAPSFQGQGLGAGALRTLIEFGFNSLGLNHIYGETFEGNGAAKMFESVGFKKEGTRRDFYYRNGNFVDAHLYSILKVEHSI